MELNFHVYIILEWRVQGNHLWRISHRLTIKASTLICCYRKNPTVIVTVFFHPGSCWFWSHEKRCIMIEAPIVILHCPLHKYFLFVVNMFNKLSNTPVLTHVFVFYNFLRHSSLYRNWYGFQASVWLTRLKQGIHSM